MSQDDRAARDSDASNPPGDSARTTIPPSDPTTDPLATTYRRAKLVLADSQPPPAPDPAVDFTALPFGGQTFGEAAAEARPSSPVSSEPVDSYLNRVIADRYEVEAFLGRGSMGTVYRCRHKVLGKRFAIKIIREDLAREVEAVERFVTEAKAASAIGSKHIVEVLDYGELPGGGAYIVMEYLEGMTLYGALERTPRLPAARALDIAIQLADALSAAHTAGVVHRDLKPDNVFLVKTGGGKDFAKILDFGIAKILRSGSKLTQAGTVMGTPAYMSPEQALGSATDARTDQYALGIMLYEMVSGQVPFDAESPLAVLSMQVTDEPPALATRVSPNEQLPPGYEAVVAKCLAKRPEDRFASMDELKAALETIASGFDPHVPEPRSRRGTLSRASAAAAPEISVDISTDDLAELRGAHRRRPMFVGGALLLAALGAGAFALSRAEGERSPAAASASVAVIAAPAPAPVPSPSPLPMSAVQEVHLILFPLDARVFEGKKDLGMMPVTVELEPGEVKHLTVVRRGYITRNLKLDGSRPRVVVGLVQEGAKGSAAAQEVADRAAERAAAGERAPAPKAAETKPAAAEAPEPSPPAAAEPATDEAPEPPAPAPAPAPGPPAPAPSPTVSPAPAQEEAP